MCFNFNLFLLVVVVVVVVAAAAGGGGVYVCACVRACVRFVGYFIFVFLSGEGYFVLHIIYIVILYFESWLCCCCLTVTNLEVIT